MPTYSPAGHSELSTAAQALTPEQLASKADRAEALLGLAGTAYTGAVAQRLTLAVALQVNRLLRLEARADGEGGDVVREQRGDQVIEYGKTREGLINPVDPEAAKLVSDALVAAAAAASPASPALPASYTSANTFAW